MVHYQSCTYVSYFECVTVSVEYIKCNFNVLLDALASSLKLPSLQGQIQVITCITYDNHTEETLIKGEMHCQFTGH